MAQAVLLCRGSMCPALELPAEASHLIAAYARCGDNGECREVAAERRDVHMLGDAGVRSWEDRSEDAGLHAHTFSLRISRHQATNVRTTENAKSSATRRSTAHLIARNALSR